MMAAASGGPRRSGVHELDRHAGFPEALNLFRVRAVVRDEDPGATSSPPGLLDVS
jgi:hypothetical protein